MLICQGSGKMLSEKRQRALCRQLVAGLVEGVSSTLVGESVSSDACSREQGHSQLSNAADPSHMRA